MRPFIYIFLAFVLLSSCKSIQELVEKGDYNGAIELATKKLHGQKNKKTKHVQGLESAFGKIMERDLRSIDRLKSAEREENWDYIYDLAFRIERRQDKIRPFLPLISKDGYAATFKFINTNPILNEAARNAAEFHYKKAQNELIHAENGDKMAARNAYEHLDRTSKYFLEYKNASALIDKAIHLGTVRTLVKLVNDAHVVIPKGFEEQILSFNVSGLNSMWESYHLRKPVDAPIDYIAVLEIKNIDVSPEREKETHFVETKEIRDGEEYVLDDNGEIVLDSLGNKLTTPRYIKIQAEVVELLRNKFATVTGVVKILDKENRETLFVEPVHVESVFESYACRYFGDKRALTKKTKKRLRAYPESFPDDYQITMAAAAKLKDIFYTQLKHNWS